MNAGRMVSAIWLCVSVTAAAGVSQAGDWQASPIADPGGLQNANTELRKPAMMELGRRDGADGHPAAWGETGVDCGDHLSSSKHWCNLQLEIIYAHHMATE